MNQVWAEMLDVPMIIIIIICLYYPMTSHLGANKITLISVIMELKDQLELFSLYWLMIWTAKHFCKLFGSCQWSKT